MARKKPDKRLREQVAALVAAAAAGRPDMAWLDQAIRKAGYAGAASRVGGARETGTVTAAAGSDAERVMLWMVGGVSGADLERMCVSKLGTDPAKAKKIVAEARKRITIAADFARDEELGAAVLRLRDIYAKSMTGAEADPRTALQAQRELNRLMGLYAAGESADGGPPDDEDDVRRRLDLIASYLLPLKLADERYPVEEHARVASEIIRTHALKDRV
ncbi:MAG TPA: hypothetical protein VMY35_20100 [Phycisphaerae bacterium]|nr:hypothetical protein [Phycisphaerae bacterium]